MKQLVFLNMSTINFHPSKILLMIKSLSRFLFLVFINIFVIVNSSDIDVDQFLDDIFIIFSIEDINIMVVYLVISIAVALLTGVLLYIFKPFTEIYLLYIFKFNFYFLINLVSISTTYIVFRIYGYSRLFLLVYLFSASIILYLTDKIKQ
tara:strand:+ start:18500 stop:18949 length:450 start_codon:yes stop_codon:yes gene_type:complete